MANHYTHGYLINPEHPVTVDLAGLGGTGGQVLTGLARINQALQALDHPGLHVTAWDEDVVTPANISRQLFCTSDIGMNKAVALVTRVNRFFGTSWAARAEKYTGSWASNILVTCIDTAEGRLQIASKMPTFRQYKGQPYNEPFYWLDLGNLTHTGQVVLGTVQPVKLSRRTKGVASLPTVVKKFPALKRVKDADQGPSCSLVEALTRQDLFINSALAQFGCDMIWKLIRHGVIRHQGCYLNLDTFTVTSIKI